jgi:hypothetical protein
MKGNSTRVRTLVRTSALVLSILLGSPAHALGVKTGKVIAVYADPSDFVVHADVAGDCGSNFYHIQRSRTNFREASAVMLTAFSLGKRLILFVESCNGDRNIVSHVGGIN